MPIYENCLKRKKGDAMKLPKDKAMLLSVVNTALRDRYSSLDELALCENADKGQITEALADIGYAYDAAQNRFV